MAAKPPKAFDVWFVAANTVYKAVPYNVVAEWTLGGRLGAADMVRPAGTQAAWAKVGTHEMLTDYIPRPTATVAPVAAEGQVLAPAAVVGGTPVELPDPELPPSVSRFEEDDEVDMIPLIDISMVLLVFFIIMQAAGALAPVDVPEMKYGGQLSNDPGAITITIEKVYDPNVPKEEREQKAKVEYAVRIGGAAPKPSHDKLQTPEDAIRALKEALTGAARPPEVRIACRKDLPRERVYELRRELEPLRKQGTINSTVATVVEAPNK